MRRSPRTEVTARRARGRGQEGGGVLLVIVGAELTGPDLIIAAARRRTGHLRAIEYPLRLTTRRGGPQDTEIPMGRMAFGEIEREVGFAATWEAGGHRYALPASLRHILADGRSAVVAAPAGTLSDLHDLCNELRVFRLITALDAAREPLTPRSCLRRMMGARLAGRLEARGFEAGADVITLAGDIAIAVRDLTAAIERIDAPRQCSTRISARGQARGPLRPVGRFV